MALLDVAVAADLLRDLRDLDRETVVLGRQPGQQLLDRSLVVGDQAALGAPLGAVAERVEPAAAQAFSRAR